MNTFAQKSTNICNLLCKSVDIVYQQSLLRDNPSHNLFKG